jgi:hypothetical protein
MVCPTSRSARNRAEPAWHEVFLRVLPTVRLHARIAFRGLDPEARTEAVQNSICNACSAIARLAELDKLGLVYPSVLARFAVAQTKDGRMLGRPLNCKDVSSAYCQRRKRFVMQRLDKYDAEEHSWREIVIEDRHVGPAEVVRVRVDFSDWLRRLPRRNRRIAQFLALGNRTSEAARKFGVSEGRVSQLRRELHKNWHEFVSEHAAVSDDLQVA